MKAIDASEVGCIMSGDSQSLAKCDASDENIDFTNQQPTSFEVGPDVGGQYNGGMRKWKDAMRLAELFKACKLGRRSDGLQSAGYFVVAEFGQY